MADCSITGCSGDEGPGFDCNYCTGNYCSDHRLPENHDCPGLQTVEDRGRPLESTPAAKQRERSKRGVVEKARRLFPGSGTDATGHAGEDDDDGTTAGDADSWGAPSPETAPDGSLKRTDSGARPTATQQDGDSSGIVGTLRTLERHFVNLPWYTFAAIRRYGPTLVFLAVVAAVGLAVTGHPLPVDVGGFLPGGGGNAVLAGGSAGTTTTTAAGAGGRGSSGPDSPTATQTTETQADVPGVTAGGDLNETWLEHRVHHYVNQERRERGLPAMEWNQTLHDAADFHSRQMVLHDFFAHENPETGGTLEDRYYRVGMECRVPTGDGRYATGAENIAQTYYGERIRLDDGSVVEHEVPDDVAAGLVRQWMNSEGHRENVLTEHWRQEGIGIEITETAEGTTAYATQNVC